MALKLSPPHKAMASATGHEHPSKEENQIYDASVTSAMDIFQVCTIRAVEGKVERDKNGFKKLLLQR
jgi:hypothetical protein